jgi:cysteine synthase A
VRVKLEHLSPTGGGKDRAACALIERAKQDGRLSEGAGVVEASTGNLGIGLALACAATHHPLTVVMPDDATLERRALLRAYGARVELVPAEGGLQAARDRAKVLAAEQGALFLNALGSPQAAGEAWRATARELIEAVNASSSAPGAFVCGVGTGATWLGLAPELRAAFPQALRVGVHPAKPFSRIQGLGANAQADGFSADLLDRAEAVSDAEAWAMTQRLARDEGLLVGISTGANVAAAIRVGQEKAGGGGPVYTFAVDTGERYFSWAEQFR